MVQLAKKTLVAIVLLVPLGLSADEPRSADDGDLARYDARIKPRDREHWAFQPVRQPPIPEVKDARWPRNPIDRFVLAKLEEKGWKPSPSAGPRALLRRIHLDLIGLPPTPAEQEAFLKDASAEAVDPLVAGLLSRPAYGERWARHWLDLVRYAETNGYERDAVKPHVWRYRDYVIRAFNDDKPFDRFILEQLAGDDLGDDLGDELGDELHDANAETMIATGYHRLGPWDDEPADPLEDRFDQLDDLVSTTSQVFLGLTLGCARCHNHKFEPLTMHDYYRMVAIFSPLKRPTHGRTELDLPAGTRAEIATAFGYRLSAVSRTAAAISAGPVASFSALWPIADGRQPIAEPPRGYFLWEPGPEPPKTHLLLRGKATRPGPEVAPGVPAVLVIKQPAFLAKGDYTSRRRLTLARWIASRENPLTARVIVNRVWQFHFGVGLVRTPSDFGVMGEAPTHPELLDWLAHWFVTEGWSIKKLHRLILASNTYRMSKRWNADYGGEDPENRLLWRFPYRRLEVEAIRDSMLAVSGKLNGKMYGASMYPHVPKEALEGHSDPDKIWKPFDEEEASRRTIYAHIKRSMVVPMLEVLDLCDTARTSAQRSVTTVAPQALTLLNGDFTNRQARHLAERLRKELGDELGDDPAKQVERAYLLALCRPPTPNERDRVLRFLEQEKAALLEEQPRPTDADARRQALEQFCRLIFNLNEFVYPD